MGEGEGETEGWEQEEQSGHRRPAKDLGPNAKESRACMQMGKWNKQWQEEDL